VHIGRLVLRSHHQYVMWLPSGYKAPMIVYLVEWLDERDQSVCQFGGFTTEGEAQACIARLEAEGRGDLWINICPIHERLSDWEWDR